MPPCGFIDVLRDFKPRRAIGLSKNVRTDRPQLRYLDYKTPTRAPAAQA
jgi:hypothetical protein